MKSATILVNLGPSNSGKSSFHRAVLVKSPHKDKIKIGDGSGISMTDMVTHYEYQHPILGNLVLIDIPGLDDNRMIFTSGQIMDMINKELFTNFANKYQYLSAVLLVDSLKSDTCYLNKTIQQAKQIFPGINVQESSLIIFSKADRLGEEESKQQASARMQNFEGFQSLIWSSSRCDTQGKIVQISNQLMDYQCTQLKQKLANIKQIKLSAITTLQQRISYRAKQLCDNQPKRTKTVYQDVVKSRIVYDNKQQVKIVKKTKTVPVQKVRKVERKVITRFLGIMVDRDYVWDDQIYTENQEQEYEVPQTYTVQVPREQKYSESVAKQIDDPLPVDYFMAQAQTQIKSEIREEVRVMIANAKKS